MSEFRGYVYLGLCICLAIGSQIIMKWQVNKMGPGPGEAAAVFSYVIHLLLNPWVIAGAVATFFAGVAWLLAISELDLTRAYPFLGLIFLVMLAAGVLIFGETFTWQKLAGSAFIAVGIVLSVQG